MSTRTWRAGLARGWRLAVAAAVLLAVGLALLARASEAGGDLQFEDLALDERASRTQASVTSVDAGADRNDWVRVRYEFVDLAGRQVQGSCWDLAGAATAGSERVVEFLADQPAISRLQAGRRTLDDHRATWPLGLLVLPSMLLLLFWLRGAARWVTEHPSLPSQPQPNGPYSLREKGPAPLGPRRMLLGSYMFQPHRRSTESSQDETNPPGRAP